MDNISIFGILKNSNNIEIFPSTVQEMTIANSPSPIIVTIKNFFKAADVKPELYRNLQFSLRKDLMSCMFFALAWASSIFCIQKYFLYPIANALFNAKSTTAISRNNKSSKDKRINDDLKWKFVSSFTKFFSYMTMIVVTLWALRGEWHWVLNYKIMHVPFAVVPEKIRLLYLVELGYYFCTIITMFWEPKMKDQKQMIFHHLFTITLLCTSFYYNTIKYGMVIMILHDVSDPLMEMAKMLNYCKLSILSSIFFAAFASSFIYLRTYIYPKYVISSVCNYARPAGYPAFMINYVCLNGLWFLHIFWSFLIIKILVNQIFNGVREDCREEKVE